LATVRIYKVAELLGTTSQEVLQLLKQNHGIELKSASSTLEEIVARQFVERLARQREIALPSGDMFSDAPTRSARAGRRAARPAPRARSPRPSPPSPPRPRCRRRG
jgi:predicted transcriptional regulator